MEDGRGQEGQEGQGRHQVMPLLEEIGLMGAEHGHHLADDDERTGHLSIVMMAGSVGLIFGSNMFGFSPACPCHE